MTTLARLAMPLPRRRRPPLPVLHIVCVLLALHAALLLSNGGDGGDGGGGGVHAAAVVQSHLDAMLSFRADLDCCCLWQELDGEVGTLTVECDSLPFANCDQAGSVVTLVIESCSTSVENVPDWQMLHGIETIKSITISNNWWDTTTFPLNSTAWPALTTAYIGDNYYESAFFEGHNALQELVMFEQMSGPLPVLPNAVVIELYDLGDVTGDLKVYENVTTLTSLTVQGSSLYNPMSLSGALSDLNLSNKANLTYLEVANAQLTSLTGDGDAQLCDPETNARLATIDLDGIPFYDSSMAELRDCVGLAELSMYWSYVREWAPVDWPLIERITYHSSSNGIDWRQMGDFDGFIESLGHADTRLHTLGISGAMLWSYPEGFYPSNFTLANFTQLTYLDLFNMQLDMPVQALLGSEVGLTWVNIESNRFTGELSVADTESLFASIEVWSSDEVSTFTMDASVALATARATLWSLSFRSPTLSGELNMVAADGNYPNLQVLTITQCNVTGVIELEAVYAITYMNIEGTAIQLLFPSGTGGGLQYLHTLWASDRDVPEEYFPDFSGFSSLEYLGLESTNLYGDIGSLYAINTGLKSLYLGYNELWGDLSMLFNGTCTLQVLSVPYNQLSGEIDARIVECEQLQVLDITANVITSLPKDDKIDSFTNKLPMLTELLAAHNYINTIPDALGDLLMPNGQLTKVDFFDNAVRFLPTFLALNASQTNIDFVSVAFNLGANPLPCPVPRTSAYYTQYVDDELRDYVVTCACMPGSRWNDGAQTCEVCPFGARSVNVCDPQHETWDWSGRYCDTNMTAVEQAPEWHAGRCIACESAWNEYPDYRPLWSDGLELNAAEYGYTGVCGEFDGTCDPGLVPEYANGDGKDEHGWLVNYECRACDAGQYQLEWDCFDCPEGQVNDLPGMAGCTPCNEGEFASADNRVCDLCPNGQANPDVSRDEDGCRDCEAGTFSNADSVGVVECSPCPGDTYQLDAAMDFCVDCPEGGVCDDPALKPIAGPGYYQESDADLVFLQCATPANCKGWSGGAQSQCATGYDDFLCAYCADGYYVLNNRCHECPDYTLALMIIAVILVFVVFGCIYALGGGVASRMFGAPVILLNFMQVTSVFSTLNIPWPDELLTIFQLFGYFNLSLEASSPECSFSFITFRFKWWFMMLLPFMILAVFAAIYAASFAVPMGSEKRQLFWNRTVKGFALFMSVLYLILTERAFAVFDCTSQPSGDYTLDADPSTFCWEGDHWQLLLPGVACMALYAFGIPALAFKIAHAGSVGGRFDTDENFRAKFGHLADLYKPHFWYWELLIFGRKFMFVLSKTFFTSHFEAQLVLVMLVMALALALELWYWPYVYKYWNVLEASLLGVGVFLLALGVCYLAWAPLHSAVAICAIALLMSVLAMVGVVILMEIIRFFNKGEKEAFRGPLYFMRFILPEKEILAAKMQPRSKAFAGAMGMGSDMSEQERAMDAELASMNSNDDYSLEGGGGGGGMTEVSLGDGDDDDGGDVDMEFSVVDD